MTSRKQPRFDLRNYRKNNKEFLKRLAVELYGQEEQGKTLKIILIDTIHAVEAFYGVTLDHGKDTHSQT